MFTAGLTTISHGEPEVGKLESDPIALTFQHGAMSVKRSWNMPKTACEPEKTETPLTVEGLLRAMNFAETNDPTHFLSNLRIEIQRMLL